MNCSSCLRTPLSSPGFRRLALVLGLGVASFTGVAPAQAQQMCGGITYPFPFTDVSGVGTPFCPGIMEAYVTGISRGTSPTTFSPTDNVPRLQMTTFLQRSVDQVLARGSFRAAAEQWWVPQGPPAVQTIGFATAPVLCKPDRSSIWVAVGNTVVRVDAATGTVLGTWTLATSAFGILVAAGKVYVTGDTSPGVIYVIDPTLPPGAVATLATSGDPIGNNPNGITFDGTHLWTANFSGSVSIITLQAPLPSPVTTVTTGFGQPFGILFDGAHVWVTDYSANALLKLSAGGAIVQTVATGVGPAFPVFDGANIWVPDSFGTGDLTVVGASTGAIVATIASDAANQISSPASVAFDGARILVTNQGTSPTLESVTLFKAADLSLIGNVNLPNTMNPYGACSDGLNFWISDPPTHKLIRF